MDCYRILMVEVVFVNRTRPEWLRRAGGRLWCRMNDTYNVYTVWWDIMLILGTNAID